MVTETPSPTKAFTKSDQWLDLVKAFEHRDVIAAKAFTKSDQWLVLVKGMRGYNLRIELKIELKVQISEQNSEMYGPTIEPTKCNCKNDFFRRAIKCTQEISIRSSCGTLLLCPSCVWRLACGVRAGGVSAARPWAGWTPGLLSSKKRGRGRPRVP